VTEGMVVIEEIAEVAKEREGKGCLTGMFKCVRIKVI
jgi:hypothetical protein